MSTQISRTNSSKVKVVLSLCVKLLIASCSTAVGATVLASLVYLSDAAISQAPTL